MKLPTQMLAVVEVKLTIGGQSHTSRFVALVDINYDFTYGAIRPTSPPCLLDSTCSGMTGIHMVDHAPNISICKKCTLGIIRVGDGWAAPGSDSDCEHEPHDSQE